MAAPQTCGKPPSNTTPLHPPSRGLHVPLTPSPLVHGPSALERRLLQAAADGDLQLFKRTARALHTGKGRLRDAVQAVKNSGAGALQVAAGSGRMAVCAYLVEGLRLDVNAPDKSGDTPLVNAVRGGTVGVVQYLLEHGANPDKADGKGCTPLHFAAEGGHCEIVKALLSKGANVDSFCDAGTPLHMAAFCENDDVIKILLDHHADCNKAFNDGYTPLYMALIAGSLKCVKLLIEAGADVKGVGTVIPLVHAANKGLTDFYNCLLEAGADANVPDEFGHLPIEIAAYNNRRKDVEILLPVTSHISSVRDWSVDGIISYVKSMPWVEDDSMKPDEFKLEGSRAYKRKDYLIAVLMYSMAAKHCPDDATLYSSMSLCWLKMGQGDRALMDAQHCRMQRPGWAKAWFLEGAAQMLLKDYEKACDAFLDALKLDPTDAGTEKALWEAFNRMKSSRADK
ncbi:unnamed protein product [Urochloa decumbens]|uniref:Uncharacterized protein n=1 Tax=Urochloa decumbens TaxID=240449 RepID=A0ABC8VC52_9POAL